MNWDRIEGNWKQLKGRIREEWGKLTDDDDLVVAGRHDQIVGRYQELHAARTNASNGVDLPHRDPSDDFVHRYH